MNKNKKVFQGSLLNFYPSESKTDTNTISTRRAAKPGVQEPVVIQSKRSEQPDKKQQLALQVQELDREYFLPENKILQRIRAYQEEPFHPECQPRDAYDSLNPYLANQTAHSLCSSTVLMDKWVHSLLSKIGENEN